ncbi:hypothetical protein LS71_007890 [Helicobacter jaachi]|uniref:Dynamin N-terminal domain-containing protein n=1 Tax=Helicobacter jaachi TaxID=1677920 RepID=A0A4U8T879_9HELI|nr:dynamin family protein [Helicobacter jaachi]TLD95754.1 hypothetical protein LS71_007890 [Helicobacter jaachi]
MRKFIFNVFRKCFAQEFQQEEEKFKKLNVLHRDLVLKYESLETNLSENMKNLEDLNLKFQIVSNVLQATNHNEHLKAFSQSLEEWVKFSSEGVDLNDEIEIFLKLKNIEKKLELVCAYPKLYQNPIIAVGGGFSSGKSEFISSFIEDENFKLAIDIKPTTAIPAYVFNDEDSKVLANTYKEAFVNLDEIQKGIYSQFSHDFIEAFGFNLKDIMPFVVLGVNMRLKHLCFIDTPGYNPSGSGFSSGDSGVAREFLGNADTLFWLIGLDANGTISTSDLKFLNTLNLEDKELFIILNKADLKSNEDLEDILDNIAGILDDELIGFGGISAYSAKRNKEYAFRKMSLLEYMDTLKVKKQIHNELVKELYEVDEMVQKDLLLAIKERKFYASALKSVEIDLLQNGLDDFSKPYYMRIGRLKDSQDTRDYEHKLNELGKHIEKLKSTIDGVFKKVSPLQRRIYTQDDVESQLDFEIPQVEIPNEREPLTPPDRQRKKRKISDECVVESHMPLLFKLFWKQ